MDISRRPHQGGRRSHRTGGQFIPGRRQQGHMGSESLTYAVWHHTTLRYTNSVSLSFNEVRMRPRDRGSQRTLSFSLLSNPAAVPRSRVDYFGNYVHRVDVTTAHDVLEFAMEAVVENSEPRRRRMPEWAPGALASDPRLEFAL